MVIVKSEVFKNHPELIFGFSTKIGGDKKEPYCFNMSLSVGDDENKVKGNRDLFFKALGLETENVAIQNQIHDTGITIVQNGGVYQINDALITNKTGLGLAVSSADCTTIFIFDKQNKIIAGVHSGWRGTSKKILSFTIKKLKQTFNTKPENIIAFIGPSISLKNYGVSSEVAEQFDEKYLHQSGDKFLLDVSVVNYDILLNYGVKKENIERAQLCSFEEQYLLHSYRRDGKISGRALGVIAMK